jgi:hypothetical protein
VHFWATWCPSCVDEVPDVARAAAECARSVDVALVDVGEPWDEVRAFAAAHGIAAILLRDPKGDAWRRAAGGWGLPANVLWTADGRRSEVGPHSAERWREELARLGCEPGGGAPPGSAPEPRTAAAESAPR